MLLNLVGGIAGAAITTTLAAFMSRKITRASLLASAGVGFASGFLLSPGGLLGLGSLGSGMLSGAAYGSGAMVVAGSTYEPGSAPASAAPVPAPAPARARDPRWDRERERELERELERDDPVPPGAPRGGSQPARPDPRGLQPLPPAPPSVGIRGRLGD